jgi:hypothetical protein
MQFQIPMESLVFWHETPCAIMDNTEWNSGRYILRNMKDMSDFQVEAKDINLSPPKPEDKGIRDIAMFDTVWVTKPEYQDRIGIAVGQHFGDPMSPSVDDYFDVLFQKPASYQYEMVKIMASEIKVTGFSEFGRRLSQHLEIPREEPETKRARGH